MSDIIDRVSAWQGAWIAAERKTTEAKLARLRRLLEEMAHDSAKYPQLQLPEMQQDRLDKALKLLAPPAETGHE